jgi:glycosyltransferase involved in cell wall biosynthesis
MIRIAFVIPTLDRVGGAETQVKLLAQGLARRGWQVDVVVLSGDGGHAKNELTSAGIGFSSLGMRRGLADPRGWWRFHRWLVRREPEIVHAHLPHAAWLVRWSGLIAPGAVVIDTIHTSAIGRRGKQIGYRWSNRLTKCVTAVSLSAANAYIQAEMVSKDRLVVIPNGIDVERWRPGPDARLAIRKRIELRDDFLWVSVGRLEPVKDYATLVRAFKAVSERARLVICGTGALEGEVRRLIADLRLEERVLLLGHVDDVLPWVQAADGFVLASQWEGLPMSVLEAMACGIPAVATDVAGTGELIPHGLTGLLAPAKNIDQLASAMMQLMNASEAERVAMGLRARELAVEHYSLERILGRWEALYRQLLCSHAERAAFNPSAPEELSHSEPSESIAGRGATPNIGGWPRVRRLFRVQSGAAEEIRAERDRPR